METTKPAIKPIAFTYGLYLGLLTIVGLVIAYITNLDKSWVLSGVSIVITILIYFYGIKTYKAQNGNMLSIKDAIKVGLAMAAVGGVIAAVYAFIHYSYIYPEFIDKIREQAYLDMTTKNPNMTQDQVDQASGMMNMFTSPFFMSTMTLIWSLFFGLIVSLITGAIMKKD